jgi:hypothetical protein
VVDTSSASFHVILDAARASDKRYKAYMVPAVELRIAEPELDSLRSVNDPADYRRVIELLKR